VSDLREDILSGPEVGARPSTPAFAQRAVPKAHERGAEPRVEREAPRTLVEARVLRVSGVGTAFHRGIWPARPSVQILSGATLDMIRAELVQHDGWAHRATGSAGAAKVSVDGGRVRVEWSGDGGAVKGPRLADGP